ncbi:MAG: carboxypeptidase regulatory-like domain-containing protein [Thermoanaerobaculia bacterium]
MTGSPMSRGRWRATAVGICVLFLAVTAFAQSQTGNISGRVVDQGGDPLPGVTLTLTGGGAPRVFVTDDNGAFRFLSLSPGRYSVIAELVGIGSVRRSIDVNVGRNSEVMLTMTPALEQTITVTAETPLLDVRQTGTGATVTRIELEEIPTARDPWVVLQQIPGVLMDRVNVGGNESGQQSQYVGKGVGGDQATWNVDGVVITDMAATGSSPTYYDFDAFEEMQATTGGSDPRVQTAGVQLNMVTKRGTNELDGSARYFWTDNEFQDDPVIPTEAQGYLSRVNEIDNIQDYGIEAGGAIIRDRLWLWGAVGRNEIDILAASGAAQARDFTLLENINAKLNAQVANNNSATVFYSLGDKIKEGRNVGPTRPPETAWNQEGPTDIWKFEDTHIFSPNFYATAMYSTVGGGFQLIPAGGLDVNDVFLDPTGVWHNSFYYYYTDRPQTQYRADASTFFDTGDIAHELKFGFGYRETPVTSVSGWPGDAWAYMFNDTEGLAFLYRTSAADYQTEYMDFYVGDTMLLGNLTIQAGVRFDMQEGSNNPSSTGANPIIPEFLPAVSSAGDTEGIEWRDISPRIGATYSMGSDRRTLLRAAYNRYADQLGAGPLFGANPLGAYQYFYYYFEDLNGDKQVQRNEILGLEDGPLGWYNIDPNNPGVAAPLGRYDDNLEAPYTDEFLIGVEQELLPEFVIGLNYTHRKMNNFVWTRSEKDFLGSGNFYSSADYVPGTPVTGTLPNGSSFTTPTWQLAPGVDRPVFGVVQNRPDYEQTYDGIELNATKRLANRWMMRASVSFADWEQSVGPNGYIDPTELLAAYGCSSCDGEAVVQGSGTGSGAKGGIYINSKWSYVLTGLYELPWDVSIGASIVGREGYPIPQYANHNAGDGIFKNVLINGVDPVRNDDIMNLDLRLAKEVNVGPIGLTLSADVFNVTDERTVMQRQHQVVRRGSQFAAANRILELQSPRVIRFGARLRF